MNHTLTLALLFSISIIGSLIAEESSTKKTELEAFNARSGSVLIKGYSEVALIEFKGPSSVGIDVRELIDAGAGEKKYGITVEVKQGGRIERKDTSFIDESEIESLIKGIEYISKIDKTATSLNSFEAIYKTKGDLAVTVFNSSNGKLMAAVTAGRIGPASVYMELTDLVKVKDAIVKAKEMLSALKK